MVSLVLMFSHVLSCSLMFSHVLSFFIRHAVDWQTEIFFTTPEILRMTGPGLFHSFSQNDVHEGLPPLSYIASPLQLLENKVTQSLVGKLQTITPGFKWTRAMSTLTQDS